MICFSFNEIVNNKNCGVICLTLTPGHFKALFTITLNQRKIQEKIQDQTENCTEDRYYEISR